MAPSILALVAKGLAAAYGLLALGASVIYSLSRKDTWQKPSAAQVEDFQTACKRLWSLSDDDGDLSHNFLTLQNGLRLHYLSPKVAPESYETLVIFLHGFPDSCYLWEKYLRSGLAQKAKLVALDLPGFGGSGSHSSYGPNQILNAASEAIFQLKSRYANDSEISSSPMRSVLVSHDWGGVVAFRLAGETSGLIDEVVVLNSSYPWAARDQTAYLLAQSRDAVLARRFKDALPPLQSVGSQLLLSNYIFMLSLRLPLAKWMPWLATSLVKACNTNALQSSPQVTSMEYTKSLAASYGPSPTESATTAPNGTTYGPTVRLRAQTTPQGDWDHRVCIYSEGLALGKWSPDYPEYQPPIWKSHPELARKGSFSYPMHVVFGMQDIALEPRLVLEGLQAFMQVSDADERDLRISFEHGIMHETFGRSSITKLPLCGHWAMADVQGERALVSLLNVLIKRSA
ncbi:hypothetical protein Q7P37_005898 [Cladosporium fusiforme]